MTTLSFPSTSKSTPPIMDGIASVIFLLTFELPDPNQEICLQLHEPALVSFTCFQKLPPELRHKIWRYCFPKGRIATVKILHSIVSPARERVYCPITLRVNHESRSETLTRYRLLFSKQQPEVDLPLLQPIIYDSNKDLISVSCNEGLFMDRSATAHCRITVEDFGDIRFLELRGAAWFWIDRAFSEHIRPHILQYLRRVEIIYLEFRRPRYAAFFEALAEQMRKMFIEYFEGEKRKEPDRTVPKIIARPWRKRSIWVHGELC
ncbi:hypothetical protein B7494_g981 [Chlorociboria aeruginascens]|nr:hypothetical protein B7494_g981 [Chlorociboria aeruginascens]